MANVKVILTQYLILFYYFFIICIFTSEYITAIRIEGRRSFKYPNRINSYLKRERAVDFTASKSKLSGHSKLSPSSVEDTFTGNEKSSVVQNGKPRRSLLSYASPRTMDICNTEECSDAAHFLLRSMNFEADPCEDFFEFTCGRWIKENPIPPTASAWSYNGMIEQHVDMVARDILMTPVEVSDSKPLRQAKELHFLCTNTAAIEKQGLLPLLKILERYGGWPVINPNWKAENFKLVESVADINHVYSSFLSHAILVNVGVEEDLKDTTKRIIFLDQATFPLGRPILLNPKRYKHRHSAYKTFFMKTAETLASFTGENITQSQLNLAADDVITLETMLALASSADENRTNYERLFNQKRIDAWQKELDSVETRHDQAHAKIKIKLLLDHIFSTSGINISPQENVQVYEPQYFVNLIKILDVTPLKTVANLVLWRLVEALLPETTEEMRMIKFDYDKVIYGMQKPVFREWICPDKVVSQGFGMAIASKFIEMEEFGDEEMERVEELVENVRNAFVRIVQEESEWLDNKTRMATVEKIVGISKFLGFPMWVFNKTRMNEEFRGFEIVRGNYLQSAIALSQWFLDEHFKSLRLPNDKNTWHVHPAVVNAFYYPQSNSIHMPAAYVSSPRFVLNGPESLNYGGLGAILGHELTHSLDMEGSQFDIEGNFKSWSSPFKIPAFQKKANCLIEQYTNFVTPMGRVNGRLTLSENIADNGGMRQAFRAYMELLERNNGNLKGQRLPRLEGFTPEQLFFVGYGINWCSNMRREELENYLIESHSPPKFRVWGALQNSQEFSDVWKCPKGSPMNPFRKKCIMW